MAVLKWIFLSLWCVLKKIGNVLFGFFILLIFISSYFAIKYEIDRKDIPNEAVLYINFERVTQEHVHSPLDVLFRNKLTLTNVMDSIEKAKTDNRIKGIVADVSKSALSFAQVQEIEPKLKEFKETGKFLIAYANRYENKNYYLASLFSEVWMPETSTIELSGFSREFVFYKNLFRMIGVEAQIVRRHEYKGAPERFLRENLSEPTKENIKELYRSLYKKLVADISKSRSVLNDNFEYNAEIAATEFDQNAVKLFIDQFGFMHSISDQIKREHKIDNANWIGPAKYMLSFDQEKIENPKKLVVLYLEGAIQDPDAPKDNELKIFPNQVERAILKAIDDEDVKGIILRINSPGGSYLGSDQIWSALELAKKNNIYVAVSMSGVTASGGYYIATAAHKIVAQPSTITGSIGIYGGKFHIQGLSESAGMSTDTLQVGRAPLNESMLTAYSETDLEQVNKFIDIAYNVFLSRVKNARGLTDEELDKLARGRVWIGDTAKEKGLVDELGGLDDTIKLVKAELEMDDLIVERWPQIQGNIFELLGGMYLYFDGINHLITEIQQVISLKNEIVNQNKYPIQAKYNHH